LINAISRYAKSPVALLDTHRGSILTITAATQQPRMINFTYVRTDAADRLDAMAGYLYGDERFWWKIADANPEIMDWTDLPVGTVLRIPSAD